MADSAPPLLHLLQLLLDTALRAAPGGAAGRITAVRLAAQTVELEFEVRGLATLLPGAQRLAFTIVSTSPERTVLEPVVPQSGGLGRLLGGALGLSARWLPRGPLNVLMGSLLGGSFRLEDGKLVLLHRELITHLTRSAPP